MEQRKDLRKMNRKKLLISGLVVIGAAAFVSLLASGVVVDVSGLLGHAAMPLDGMHP
jgi:F0F1-type ATP synthase assembly protein I